jgi:hypothetical protein
VVGVPGVVGRQVRHDRRRRDLQGGVERRPQTAVVLGAQQAQARVVRHRRLVGGAVVHDDALEVDAVLRQQAPERPRQERRLVVDGDQHGDRRGHRRCTSA